MAASELYWSNQNPYLRTVWLDFWQARIAPSDVLYNMIWNPPEIFLILLPFNLLSLAGDWALLSFNALLAFHLNYLALRIVKPAICQIPIEKIVILFTLANIAILHCLKVGQISIYLSWFLVFTFYNYINRRYFLAGALGVILLVKPHVFAAPLALLLADACLQKRKFFIIGAFFSASALFILAEINFVGIHKNWLFREAWPISIYGTTLSGALRVIILKVYNYDPVIESLIFFVMYAAVVTIYLVKKGVSSIVDFFPVTLLLLPVISPYGFIFDFVLCGVPFLWLSALLQRGSSGFSRVDVYFLMSFFVAVLCLFAFLDWSYLFWLAQPLMLVIIWVYLEIKDQNSFKLTQCFNTHKSH